jgi:amino acid adenylation domain-containing protein
MNAPDRPPDALIVTLADFVAFPDAAIHQSLPQRFAAQVRAHGDKLAIRSDRASYTYASLDRTANRLAQAILARRGEGPEPIALLFEHGAEALVAIVAVLKAGKFYVVLDPTYPHDRLHYMLADSTSRLVVTDAANAALAATLAGGGVDIVGFDDAAAGGADHGPVTDIGPESLAMLLYTSGSTGRPKGVMHTHRGILADARNLTNGWGASASDRWLLHTSLGFANSVRSTYTALMNGGSLFPYDVKERGFGALPDWVTGNEITIFRTVSTFFRNFMASLPEGQIFPSVRLMSVGGEPMFHPDLAMFNRHFAPPCVLAHALGPTETLTACWRLLPHGASIADGKLAIGRALPDKEVLLLDEDRREVADGDVGELAVRSRYISPGYWRDPARTAAAFIADPAGSDARVYLTGDLGRRLPDGNLLHVGRRDFQVKIRGHRVDVSEIDAALRAIDGVADAVAVGREDALGEVRLVAYYVATGQRPVSPGTLRRALATALPDFMMPSAFVALDSLPQTPTGKTDRQRLPAPDQRRVAAAAAFAAPRTALERGLATIWAEVLGIESVGVDDEFTDLGGDSLAAALIIARAETLCGVALPMPTLFHASTVARMAEVVTAAVSRA